MTLKQLGPRLIMQGIFNVEERGGVPFRSIHFTGQSLRNSLFAALYEELQKTGHQMGLLLLICYVTRGGTKNWTSNGPITPYLLRYTRGYKKQDIKWACYSSFAALYEGVQKTGHQMGLLLQFPDIVSAGMKEFSNNLQPNLSLLEMQTVSIKVLTNDTSKFQFVL